MRRCCGTWRPESSMASPVLTERAAVSQERIVAELQAQVREHAFGSPVDRWPLAVGRWPLAVGRWPLA
eukprot:392840-Rhodomonas_salina.1